MNWYIMPHIHIYSRAYILEVFNVRVKLFIQQLIISDLFAMRSNDYIVLIDCEGMIMTL